MPKKWYQITNKKDEIAEIDIFGEISESGFDESITAKEFIKELNSIDAGTINLHISSRGGDVFGGLAIYNSLKAHKAKIVVKIDGLAASIASVIAMAGDTIEVPENAFMMIHDPSSFACGTSKDMRKMADTLDKIKLGLISAYQAKTGLNENEIADIMSNETWYTAQEAVDKGFADTIINPVEIQASVNMSQSIFQYRYKNMPDQLITAEKFSNKQERVDIMNVDELKTKYTDLYNAVFESGKLEGTKIVDVETKSTLQAEAAKSEMERIKSVEAQLMVGHEALIEDLKWDGKTTGEQAAMAVLQAEKGLRANMQKQLDNDGVEAVEAVIIEDVVVDNNLDFMAMVSVCEKEDGYSHGRAIAHVAKTNPKDHADWIAKINKGD